MAMEPIIKVCNLSYKVGQRYLLHHINWEVQPGENWVIFGLNGSGKTTLLSIVAGFKSFTEGSLEIMGQTYTNENILDIRKQVGWISSSFFDKYFSRETVLHVVLSGLSGSFGLNYDIQKEDVRRAKALLTELRMEHKMDTLFSLLSKGERQNVLIARAMLTQPKILLLDEPDNGLDVYAREHTQNTIQALAEDDEVTIIYVTHYPESILPQFDHCLLLRYGQIFAQGRTEDMLCSERISALMGDSVSVTREQDGRYRMRLNVPSKIRELCYGQREEADKHGKGNL